MTHRTSLLVALALCAACRTTTGTDLTGEDAPGVPATIIHEAVQVAGGRATATVVTFDSLAGTFDRRSCPNGGSVAVCPGLERRTGPVDRTAFDDLWRMVATSEFRSLRPYYGFTDGVVPPDANGVTLTVVANGRRWRVSRDVRAPSPAILGRIDCRLLVVQGTLISCT